MATPLDIIRDSADFPEKTSAIWNMLMAAEAKDVGDMKWSLATRADAFSLLGRVYVFLPGLVVVYRSDDWANTTCYLPAPKKTEGNT